MTANLTNPIFQNEEKAIAHFEAIRWPDGPVCPHCGVAGEATSVQGKSHRLGMWQCNACREPFTVKVGTVMESSHIPMHKWALAFHLVAASKKGVSAYQLHRMLGITYKSAWFMEHRIREAMRRVDAEPLGGKGKSVEIDETFIGTEAGKVKKRGGGQHKRKVVSLVEHCGDADLQRYLDEFDFRYSNRVAAGVDDVLRTMRAIKGAEGKRLTYKQPRSAQPA
ncbi:MAG TPA: IS1595 family transposase [Stellaceae bacterium]|nr:IS1595 family transposase [Stellaceae bacterium]